jgi:release factor glutamine methyltransferase
LIVDIGRAELERRFPHGELRVLEFGTGSGAIAVSLVLEMERVHVVATEQSAAAAEVALQNARRHGAEPRLAIRVQRDFAGITPGFHAIVTNPPYVPEGDRASLPPDVAKHEPAEALFAGADGLDAIRFIVAEAPRMLLPGGFMLTEIGAAMAEAVEQVAASAKLKPAGRFKDYAGIDRFVLLEIS